jgi:DNA-binding NtrC family response regulator
VTADNRLLLIEADPSLKRSLENYLKRFGYTFDSCATARDALILAAKNPYGMILAEYHLPDANGALLLNTLKSSFPAAVTILLSEYDHHVIAENLARTDIQFYLKKPFDLVELESVLSSSCADSTQLIDNASCNQDDETKGIPAPIFSNRELSEVEVQS